MQSISPVTQTLRDIYAPRHIRFVGIEESLAAICKGYEISKDGSPVAGSVWTKARQLYRDFLGEPSEYKSTGLGIVIVHAGADGEYILLHEWIEGFMSRQRIDIRNRASNGAFISPPEGLAPCIWERAIYDHENLVHRELLASAAKLPADSLAAWKSSTLSGVW